MIRYYFGGKPGLYREMFNTMSAPVRAGIDAMTHGFVTVDLGTLLNSAVRMWAANPWLLGLIIREVLLPEGPFRGVFIKEFPERLAPLVEKIVQREIERGHIREGLDPKLTVLSMISLALFPFLALPVTSKVFGVRQDEEFLQKFLTHTANLLAHGIETPRQPENKA
jgi:AcrR family transcriptional regulator